MKKICIYGKGGIGKSTTVANLAAALAADGKRVAVIGCDPKADSTRNIMGKRIGTVLDLMHRGGGEPICQYGFSHILCMEAGGPQPGTGCAGRGITVALQEINKRDLLKEMDVVFYDVLGDVVCGGFSTPLREGVADEVYIVSTSDYMSLYAANNICRGIRKYAEAGGSKLVGIIHNGRSSLDEEGLVGELAGKLGTSVIGYIPMSREISRAEYRKKTVIEAFPDSAVSLSFREISRRIMENTELAVPSPLTDQEVEELCMNWRNE